MSTHQRPQLAEVPEEVDGKETEVAEEKKQCEEEDVVVCKRRILRTKNFLHVLDGLIGHVDATLDRLDPESKA